MVADVRGQNVLWFGLKPPKDYRKTVKVRPYWRKPPGSEPEIVVVKRRSGTASPNRLKPLFDN